MYDEKNLVYIFTMLECIEKTWIYTQDHDSAVDFIFANQQKDLNAVITMFVAIGEESKKIETSLKESINSDINWKNIAGIRDKISHDYRGTDEKLLWNTINKDLYLLKNALIDMIELINPPQALLDEFLSSVYYQHLQYLKGR